MAADKLRDAEIKSGLHTFFKLQTTISTTSMVLFDHLGCLKCVLFSKFLDRAVDPDPQGSGFWKEKFEEKMKKEEISTSRY